MGKRKRRRDREHALEREVDGHIETMRFQAGKIQPLANKAARVAWRRLTALAAALLVGLAIGRFLS